MKRFLGVGIFLLIAGFAHAEMTADEVIQNQINLTKGFATEQAHGTMEIINESGSSTTRKFKILQIEEQGNEGYKAMIKVTEPLDLKGTGLLTYQNKDREDDQWLYLPAMQKTRRISGSGRGGRFLGSDFNYEDLSPKEKTDFTYQTLRIEPCDTTRCYVIEAKPKDPESQYSKSVGWIREDNFWMLKMELYDKSNTLQKVLTFADYQMFNNKFWRPLKIVMQDAKKTASRTELVFSDLMIGSGVSAADFSKQALER